MQNVFSWLNKIDSKIIIILFPFVAMFHELEEWNILGWHQAVQTNVPDVTNLHLRIIFILFILGTFLWVLGCLKLRNRTVGYYLLLPFLAFNLWNGIQHFVWLIEFQRYAPGVIFGSFIGIPLIVYITWRIMEEKIIPRWYVALFGIIVIGITVNTLLLGRELDPFIRSAMLIGKTIAEKLVLG